MRNSLVIGLALSAIAASVLIVLSRPHSDPSAPALAAAVQLPTPSAPGPAPAPAPAASVGVDQPIPQDLARMERRRRERLEWNRRTVGGAYDRIGKRDPRWDEAARQAMDLAARMFSEEVDPEVTAYDVHGPAKAAVDAGCDDPMLLYLYTRSLLGPNYPGEAEMIRRMRAVAEALAASRYPAFRRAIAHELAGTYALAAKDSDKAAQAQAEREFDSALALLPESAATDERNEFFEDRWLETLHAVISGYRKLGVAAPAAYERVDARLAKLPELAILRLHLRGKFWIKYGWEARTTAFAPDVPAGGFERLEECLGVARRALEEACRLRPDDAWAATDLMDIDKAIGGDRATMESWFDRAMRANGDNYNACQTKLDWLDPKWHGTAEEMLAFGRACRATGNWRAGITLLVGDAHQRHASSLGPAGRSRYLGRPDVWSEIRAVYDEYLAHHPHNNVARSKYAALAYLGGHYREAHAQFEALGDRLTTWPISPYYPLETLKRMRDDAARKVVGGAP